MRVLLYTAFFVLSLNTCFAQNKWSLQQCVEYAINNNVSVKQSDVQLRLTKITQKQTNATLYPTLNGSVNSAYQHGLTTNPTTNILQSSSLISGNLGLQANYTIFNWGARKNNIQANNLLAQADEVNVDRARNDISLNVANAFLQVMLRREQARLSEAQVALSKSQLDNTQKLVDAGRQPELNALQLEAQLAKDSSSLLQSQALVQQALINLKAYLNFDFETPFEILAPALENIAVEPLANLQPADIYHDALNTQPLQKYDRIRVLAGEKQIKASKAAMLPDLSVFAGLNTRVVNSKYPVFGAAPADSTDAYITIGSDQYKVFAPRQQQVGEVGIPFFRQLNNNFGQNIGLSLNFSIFNSFSARSQYEKSKANLLQLQLQRDQDDLNLKTNIYNAYQDAFSSFQKYNASRRSVEYSQKAYDMARKRFEVGLLGTLDYIITQNNLYLAQIDEVSNHYDYVFKMKVLEFYRGRGVRF